MDKLESDRLKKLEQQKRHIEKMVQIGKMRFNEAKMKLDKIEFLIISYKDTLEKNVAPPKTEMDYF